MPLGNALRDLIRTCCAIGVIGLLSVPACRKPSDAGKAELGDAGYQLTRADWFRAVAENNVSVMRRFLEAGMDWKSPDDAGDLALHVAARAGAQEAAGFLLDKGMEVNAVGAQGRTPLMAAALGDQRAMVRWLVKQGADQAITDAEGYSALLIAVREGKAGAVNELAAIHGESLDPALQLAALTGKHVVIDTLTNYGASVYTRMEDGRTPLMLAAENGHTEAVRLLLDLGASRQAVDENGLTALDHASANGYQEIVALIREERPADSLSLAGVNELGKELQQTLEKALVESVVEAGSERGGVSESAPVAASGPVAPLAGAVLSAAAPSGRASSSPVTADAKSGEAAMPPLVMRLYQERELPVRVASVDQGKARVEMLGSVQREVVLGKGDSLPGTRLVVVRAERRMQESKLNLGQAMEVSVVEVRDPVTGTKREWISGHPAMAHDPVALVEDAATGKRYLALPGQRFKSADGAEFIVSDVRPDQIIIEAVASGMVTTLPLRGPRG
jgi:ankyrin repeat protein